MRHEIAEQFVVKLKVHTLECRGVGTNLPRFSACTVTVLRAPKVGAEGKVEDWG